MKKYFSLVVISVLGVATLSFADSDKKDIKPQEFNKALKPLYIQECASCHMAYQAEFLPKRSWQKMMKGLENHFGADASLDKKELEDITTYLLSNAADSKPVHGEYREFFESIPRDKTLLKISEIPYFKKEHRKIDKKLITQKEVKSLSNCTACHAKAESGSFRERDINIPNYGKWDD